MKNNIITYEQLILEFETMCNRGCDKCEYDDVGTMWQCALLHGFNRGVNRADKIDDELQNFAQWLWDSNYLVDKAFTIRLVEQYKDEQLKEQNNER